jgi:hypothetical protein
MNNTDFALRAIWDVSDELVAESENDTIENEEKQVKRFLFFKPVSAQFALVAAAALVLTVGTVLMFRVFSPLGDLPPVAENTTTSAALHTEPPKVTAPTVTAPAPGYVWIVEPTLDFKHGLVYFEIVDVFFAPLYDSGSTGNYDVEIINEKTGQRTGEIHDEFELTKDGRGMRVWLYYPDEDLFGYKCFRTDEFELHPRSEFAERFPNEIDTIKTVCRISLAKPYFDNIGVQPWTDGVAVAYGSEIVSDFIYELVSPGRSVADVTEVCVFDNSDEDELNWNYKYGIADKTGNLIVPLMFERTLIIDETTAFAMIDGKWGIIGFNGYKADTVEYPQVDCDVCGMLQFPICATECNRQSSTTEADDFIELPRTCECTQVCDCLCAVCGNDKTEYGCHDECSYVELQTISATAQPTTAPTANASATAQSNTTTPAVTTTTNNGGESLSKELELRIKQDYLDFFYSSPNNYNVDGVEILHQFGIYNGSVVLTMVDDYSGSAGVIRGDEIAGYTFVIASGISHISVWSNGGFYELQQAYDRGLLTTVDVGSIHSRHTVEFHQFYQNN